MHPKYSIIIPVYNVVKWLPYCLGSVLKQTVGDWECVCVDDGSTDGSSEILDEYQKRDTRIRVYHRPNGGVSSARNYALEIVQGEWIVYLDADDMLSGNALALFDALEEAVPDADLMHYDVKVISEDDTIATSCPEDEPVNPLLSRSRREIVPGFSIIDFWTYAYRRSVMGSLRFKGYAIGEDRLYLAQCHALSKAKVWCKNVGYLCRATSGSAIRSVWTFKKFSDLVESKRDAIVLVDGLDVEIDARARRMIYQSLLEASLFEMRRVARGDRACSWVKYFEVIGTLDPSRLPTIWQRLVWRILVATQSACCGHVLCVFPHRLKVIKTRLVKFMRRQRCLGRRCK